MERLRSVTWTGRQIIRKLTQSSFSVQRRATAEFHPSTGDYLKLFGAIYTRWQQISLPSERDRTRSLCCVPTLPPSTPLSALVRSPLLPFPESMAPITETTVSDLKDLVHKLEARVHHLESRYESGGKKPQSAAESMRMILIGPPGAGASKKRVARAGSCSYTLQGKAHKPRK